MEAEKKKVSLFTDKKDKKENIIPNPNN